MPKPKQASQSSAAMVPLQVVLAGGAGMDFDEFCQKVFQEFDPPIVTGTYSSVSRDRQRTNNELGDDSPYRNNQSEHMVANSSIQGERGNNATNIPGASGYTEGGGFAYSVYDDQSAGTEHKFLTDAARAFDQAAEGFPTVRERIQAAKDYCKDLQRTEDGQKRSRISDKPKKKSKRRKKALAQAASECLAKMAEKQFAEQGVKMDTPTRRGMAGGAPPPPKPPVTSDSAF